MLTYLAYILAGWLAPRVPRSLGYAICDLVGDVAYRVARHPRTVVRANLTHVFGGPPPLGAVRQVFRSAIRNYYDTFVIPGLTATTLHDWAVLDGEENVERALENGRGVILAGVHLGSPALASQLIGMRGTPMHIVVEPVSPPALFELISRYRSQRNVHMVPLDDPQVAHRLMRALRSNQVVGLMIDRVLTDASAAVRFFDAPAELVTGPATLALATKAVLLPSVSIRRSDGRVHGIVGEPIRFQQSGDRDADTVELTRRLVERLEYYIEQAPGQWTLFVPVWERTQELPRC